MNQLSRHNFLLQLINYGTKTKTTNFKVLHRLYPPFFALERGYYSLFRSENKSLTRQTDEL